MHYTYSQSIADVYNNHIHNEPHAGDILLMHVLHVPFQHINLKHALHNVIMTNNIDD